MKTKVRKKYDWDEKKFDWVVEKKVRIWDIGMKKVRKSSIGMKCKISDAVQETQDLKQQQL
jgi:hypothetical protein